MPILSRVAIRSALAYLVLGALGALVYWVNAIWVPLPDLANYTAALSPTYVHLIVVGWLTQFIFGVMYWMFPIINKTQPRGDTRLAWLAFALLNVGLLLRIVSEPWRSVQPTALNGGLMVASSLLQWLASAIFVALTWPRVRERGGF